MEDPDDLQPWELYELNKEQADASGEDPAAAASRLLAYWCGILIGTFTGHRHGASLTTLARLMKVFSDADLLLSRLTGMGAIRSGLWFDPKFALAQADKLDRECGPTDETKALRTFAQQLAEAEAQIGRPPPLTPHLLFCATLNWVQGQEFTWSQYEKMMPRLFDVNFTELVHRLHLVGDPERVNAVQAKVAAVASLPVKVCAPVFVRFEDRHTGVHSKDFGPYTWIELVHNELKVAPTGRHLATVHTLSGKTDPAWIVADPTVPLHQYFTNVVIGPADVPDGWTQPDDPSATGNVTAGVALPPAPGP